MAVLVELKAVSGEQIAINPNVVTALISHDGTTEVYLYGADQYFLVEGDYWTVRDKLNGKEGEEAETTREEHLSKALDLKVELPKDEVAYGYISKQFPTTNVFFDSYETALNSAIHDQPKYRPFYMIKATRHFEFCGIVEKAEVLVAADKENK